MSERSKQLLEEIKKSPNGFVLDPNEESSGDYAHFYFQSEHNGQDVVFDVMLYTLQMHYNSELYELAEKKVMDRFPEYKEMDDTSAPDAIDELDEEIGLFMADVVMELEDDEVVKVREHVDVDEENEVGIGLDVGLNVEIIDEKEILRFIKNYVSNSLQLDATYYSFQSDE